MDLKYYKSAECYWICKAIGIMNCNHLMKMRFQYMLPLFVAKTGFNVVNRCQ